MDEDKVSLVVLSEVVSTLEGEVIDAEAEEVASRLNALYREAQQHAIGALMCWLELGRGLCAQKERLGHGYWEPWLANHCLFSPAHARRFMRLWEGRSRLLEQTDHGMLDLEGLSLNKALEIAAPPRIVLRPQPAPPQPPQPQTVKIPAVLGPQPPEPQTVKIPFVPGPAPEVEPVTGRPEPQPAPEPAPRKGPLAARGRGYYEFRPYWTEGGVQEETHCGCWHSWLQYPGDQGCEWRLEAKTAEGAAKAFVRQFAREENLNDAEHDKAYRGPIQILCITSPLDAEEVFQGYQQSDPRGLDPKPPEWAQETPVDRMHCERKAMEEKYDEERRRRGEGIGGPVSITMQQFEQSTPRETREQWGREWRERELRRWRLENVWRGGEWEPVGPRFHIEGPFPS